MDHCALPRLQHMRLLQIDPETLKVRWLFLAVMQLLRRPPLGRLAAVGQMKEMPMLNLEAGRGDIKVRRAQKGDAIEALEPRLLAHLPQRRLLRRLARLHGPRRHLDAHLLKAVVRMAKDQELAPFGDVADDFWDVGFVHDMNTLGFTFLYLLSILPG